MIYEGEYDHMNEQLVEQFYQEDDFHTVEPRSRPGTNRCENMSERIRDLRLVEIALKLMGNFPNCTFLP